MGYDLCGSGFWVGRWRQRDVVVVMVRFEFWVLFGFGFVVICWVDLGGAAMVGRWLCY